MVRRFDPATSNVDDLDDLDDEDDAMMGSIGDVDEATASKPGGEEEEEEEEEDENKGSAATPDRRPIRPTSSRSGSGSRGRVRTPQKSARILAPRKAAVLSKTHWEKSLEEKKAIEDAFKALDRDGDGSLLPQDIMEATQELGLHFKRPDIYQLVGEADMDGEGRLQSGEFRGLMIEGVRPSDLEGSEFDLMWAQFDHNNTGYVDVATLRTIFAELGEDTEKIDLEKMIREAKQGRDRGTPDEHRVFKDELLNLLEAANPNSRA